MNTATLSAPTLATIAPARFPHMIAAGPYADKLRAAGYFVTITSPGKGLSGEAYMKATKDYAFEVTARPFVVGDGASILRYTDVDAFTVVKRTAKSLTLQEDKSLLMNGYDSGAKDALQFAPGGFHGHTSGTQRYVYEADPQGRIEVARLTKKGWQVKGQRVVGGRSKYYDYNF